MKNAQQLRNEIDVAQAFADRKGVAHTIYVLPTSGGVLFFDDNDPALVHVRAAGGVPLARVEPSPVAYAGKAVTA